MSSDLTQTPAAGTYVGLGTYLITIRATDVAGNFATCTSTFAVPNCSTNPPTVPSVPSGSNLAPILAAIPTQIVPKGTTMNYTNSATDPDAGSTNRIAWKMIPLTPYAPVSPAGPRGVYNNYLGLEAWRNSLAETNPINVIALGDSITEGFNSTDQNAKSFVSIIRSNLQAALGNGGLGLIPIYRGSGTSLTQFWTFNGTWIQFDPSEYGPFSSARYGSGTSSAQVPVYGDNADLHLVLGTFGETNGPGGAYYQVDNGPSNYFNTKASTTTNVVLNISLGTVGNHTVKIVAPLSGSKYVGLWGVSANVCQTGVRVHNVGRNGTKAGETSSANPRTFIRQMRPRLTILGFSSNDYSSQTDTNTYRSSMVSLIQEGLTTGSVLLVGANPRTPATNSIPQTTYHAILKELAFTYGCAFIDMRERWGSITLEQSLGLSVDQTHPTDSGHVEYAQTILSQLLPSTTATLNPTDRKSVV